MDDNDQRLKSIGKSYCLIWYSNSPVVLLPPEELLGGSQLAVDDLEIFLEQPLHLFVIRFYLFIFYFSPFLVTICI